MSLLYTTKIPHPANFTFADKNESFSVTSLGGDVHRIRGREWKNPSQAVLAESIAGEPAHQVTITPEGAMQVANLAGEVVFSSVPGETLGRSGPAWMLQFRHERAMQFYGLGEHNCGLEKSGQRVKFWNTDLIGDYSFDEIRHAHPNPMYVSIPWLIVKRGNFYIGLLVHHSGAVFMDLASNFIWAQGNNSDLARCSFFVGAPNGEPDIYLVVGPDLPALTRKFQMLVGRTPLPPRWALGYHQSRWGYAGPRDLNWLDRELRTRKIPCDGLWLDIDYMERYKVFTFSKREWGGAKKTRRALEELRARGRRVLAILDPGVKVEAGYEVYEDGLKRDLFCHNRVGGAYVGFVWPGRTHFPDFSLAETREWWAKRVTEFAHSGMAGAWLDMNDPAVGATELGDMLFDRGNLPHDAYHNEYALCMAQASHAGLLAARPNERPFLLSRSASTSSSRYTAVWTGDNLSNWHHLRMTIPVSLGLALSGIPFNGADLCGFGESTTADLAVAWYKLGFLFPVFRNHNSSGVREQEPWTFGKPSERIIARYVRLRYKFLPYLYQLFIAQEQCGEAILRPLFYDFADSRAQPLGKIQDQFMVGPALMPAPLVVEGSQVRAVLLPKGGRWYSLTDGRWHAGGRTIRVKSAADSTPLFVREGSLVPLRPGDCSDNISDPRVIELHVFFDDATRGESVCDYSADDGETFAYQRGERTTVRFFARIERGGAITLRVEFKQEGFGPLRVRVVAFTKRGQLNLVTSIGARLLPLRPFSWQATGEKLRARASAVFSV